MRHPCADFITYADEFIHAIAFHELGDLAVEFSQGEACLFDVREDEGTFAPCCIRTASHEIQGDLERTKVAVASVCDEGAVAPSLLDFQSHGHRF